jgi:hypothetical protein
MPAMPAYFHRVGDAIAALQQDSSDWVDRKAVEEALGVSKTVAWRIMRQCGAVDGPGNTLVCRRDGLIEALQKLQTTGKFERETRRRERVSAYLEHLAQFGRTRRTTVAERGRALELISSRFGKLPDGVTLTPRKLSVEFSTPEQFLEKVGAVIYALQNDFEAVREFIEAG